MQILSIKTRLLFNSEEDKQKLIEMLESEREVWNWISKEHFKINENGYLSCTNSVKELFAKCYKPARILFSNVKSHIVVKSLNDCLSTYRTIKSNKDKILEPPIKKKLSLRLDANLLLEKNATFRITTNEKRVITKLELFPYLQGHLDRYSHGDPNIFVRGKDIWISLPFKIEEPLPKNQTLAVGIDLGISRFATTSEGKHFKCKRHNKIRRKIRHLKSKLKSKGTKSARKHLKRLRRKEHNVNRNFNHHLANAILRSSEASVFVLEDLDVKKLKSKKAVYQSKNRISQVSFAEVRFLISYKAKLSGKTVMFVNPAYTSQMDALTGKLDGERKGRRYYAKGKYGKKGLVYDSDVNAAWNIAKLSELPVSYARILDGQGLVIDPYVET